MASHVLYPRLMHIGKRHYRVNPSRHELLTGQVPIPIGHLENGDNERMMIDPTDDAIDAPLQSDEVNASSSLISVKPDETGSGDGHTGTVLIPSMFHGNLIGSRGVIRNSIQHQFDCQLHVPPMGSGSPSVMVKASTRTAVHRACERILHLYTNARAKAAPTHFMCLPATYSIIQKKVDEFKQSVLALAEGDQSGDFEGVKDGIFQASVGLHFTIVPLLLADCTEVEKACRLLRDYVESDEGQAVFSGGPFRLTLKGIEYMNDDPSSVHVLYAKITSSPERDRVQRMSNALAHLFLQHGLIARELHRPDGDILLHMTLMNSRFGSRGETTRRANATSSATPFSVVGILREYGDYLFGEDVLFNQLHLSLMARESHDKFYTCCCRIDLSPGDGGRALTKVTVMSPH